MCDCTSWLASAASIASDRLAIRNVQDAPGAHQVDVAADERILVGAKQRDQHLVERHASGRFWRAIAPSVSPFFTSSCLADRRRRRRRGIDARSARGAGGAGAGAGAGAGLAAGAGAGAAQRPAAGSLIFRRDRAGTCIREPGARSPMQLDQNVQERLVDRLRACSAGSPAGRRACRSRTAGRSARELSSMPAWRNASGDGEPRRQRIFFAGLQRDDLDFGAAAAGPARN